MDELLPQNQGLMSGLPVPDLTVTKDVIDRLLFVDEFKNDKGETINPLDDFVDSIVSPELSLTRTLSVNDIRFFRLMIANLIEMSDMTIPPYMNTFERDLITEKARLRSEIKIRRSAGQDRERVLLTGHPLVNPEPLPQSMPWDKLFPKKQVMV